MITLNFPQITYHLISNITPFKSKLILNKNPQKLSLLFRIRKLGTKLIKYKQQLYLKKNTKDSKNYLVILFILIYL